MNATPATERCRDALQMRATAWQVAQFVKALRAADPDLSLFQLEMLLLLAGGHVDHSSDYKALLTRANGEPLGPFAVGDAIKRLTARTSTPNWEQHPRWILTERHPHRAGNLLRMNPEGLALLRLHGVETVEPPGDALGVEQSTCDKQ